jgi:hypothetical protein
MFFRRTQLRQRQAPVWLLKLQVKERKLLYRLSIWMQHMTEKIPLTQLKFYCAAIFLIMAGVLTGEGIQAFRDSGSRPTIKQISLPASIQKKKSRPMDTILHFEKYNH